jgi:D-beta-D-heptose 7-phosphate kinase/D-beta-D-heptose 1-phosphate adenosyltransferase
VIFTNGCFDILHLGHVQLLEFCASLGGEVVVGINSDASVRKLKGEERPVNNETTRKKILESIRYVSRVHIFDEVTPLRLILDLSPKIIVKGGDYQPQDVVGANLAEVIIFPYQDGHSTTSILQRIQSL